MLPPETLWSCTIAIWALVLLVVKVMVSAAPKTAPLLRVTFIKRPIVSVEPVTVAPVTVASVAVVGEAPVANEYDAEASPAA